MICRSTDLMNCIDLPAMPNYCNVVCATRQDALDIPRGDIELAFCRDCGHLFNRAFDPAVLDYRVGYDCSLHSSAYFQSYAQDTADRLIERYGLRGKRVLDIGCGQGEFLALLCDSGISHGIGIDPSSTPAHNGQPVHARVELIQDHYSKRYADRQADLICCRHVLEHIAAPRDLLEEVRAAIGASAETIVFLEVPNALYTLRDMGIWDIIYEHCSYFSAGSLQRLFNVCGFDMLDARTAYGNQFLCVEALPAAGATATPLGDGADIEEVAALVAAFGERYRTKVASWERELARLREDGHRIAVWGGGAKGVTFLNTIAAGEYIDCIVDINRRKQGLYIPGTGQQIVAPEELPERAIDVILVMNPIYRDEIEAQVQALDLGAEIFCV
jgi:SAM-dependent methyltransferase